MGIQKRGNKRVVAVYQDTGERYPNGRKKYKQIKKTVGRASKVSKAVAKKEYVSQERKYKNKPLKENPTLNEFIPEYIEYVRDIAGKRSWDRDVISLKHLSTVLGTHRLFDINSKDIISYQKKRLKDGVSNRTVNLELSCLRHLFNIARVLHRYAGDNPVSAVKMLEVNNFVERVLSYDEQDRLLMEAPSHLQNILVCALATGMRRGEILSLKWSNIDLDKRHVIIESTNSKNKTTRRVPINSELFALFGQLKADNHNSEIVFLNALGKPYARASAIQGVFEKTKKKAEIENFRFHDLRHTVATRLVENDVPIQRIATYLGHKDVNMTYRRYSHPDQSLHDDAETLTRKHLRVITKS